MNLKLQLALINAHYWGLKILPNIVWLSFERWLYSQCEWYEADRIYIKEKWTPFIIVKFRRK